MKYLLKSMQMARSTYYFELSKADQVAVRNHCLADEIKDIFSQHKGRYGVRRVYQELIKRGHKVNHKRVQRLMQIVDSTHTEARYHKTTQREMLKKASTSLKAALKDSDKDIYLPDEPEKRASLDEYNEYCHELLNTVQESPYSELPTIKEESSMLSEILDNQIDCYDQSIDPDARSVELMMSRISFGWNIIFRILPEAVSPVRKM